MLVPHTHSLLNDELLEPLEAEQDLVGPLEAEDSTVGQYLMSMTADDGPADLYADWPPLPLPEE